MELVEVLLPVLLIVALTATVASAGNHSSLQDITTAPPSNCPNSCGNITIKFPFGIGHGCYRSARFNLTCSDNNSSRLFLGNTTIEVLEIDTNQGFMYIKSLNATLDVADNYKSTSFDLKNLPYSFNLGTNYQFGNYGWTMNNIWHVTGCSAAAYLIDAATDTIIDSCSTLCSPTVNLTSGGNCTMHLHNWKAKNRTSLEVRLVRLNQTYEVDSNMSASSITAIMYDSYRLTDEELVQELLMQGNIKGELNATLVWYVDDDNRTTCAQAKNNTATYACRCSSSDCFDAFPSDEDNKNYIPGYLCRCSLSYSGNPYEAKGCYLGDISLFF
ncbi:wall-associated receptor kinase 1-like [Canna indica]|uniref:Wall-associated receptor kinase 1-like n=1 Tax=Canna indica TaxID=4628 RepID=A0AAQ3Q7H0_9LILI|nr:wall-associated receptor kinase 1-like [Canna indica]